MYMRVRCGEKFKLISTILDYCSLQNSTQNATFSTQKSQYFLGRGRETSVPNQMVHSSVSMPIMCTSDRSQTTTNETKAKNVSVAVLVGLQQGHQH